MATNRLYKETDNADLASRIENISTKITKDEKPQEPVVVLNESTKKTFNDIKDIFINNNPKKIKRDIYFTTKKGAKVFNIDNTAFTPPPVVLISSKFEEKYLSYLENLIYTDKESLDPDKVFSIVFIFEHIKNKDYPITVKSGVYPGLVKKIANCLNTYFNKNYSLLSSIHSMFTGISEEAKKDVTEKQ